MRNINCGLRGKDYDEKRVFGDCCDGKKVEDLWCVSALFVKTVLLC